MTKILKKDIRQLFKPSDITQTKKEIEDAFLSKLTLDKIPSKLYDELYALVDIQWKQKLNPDILFNSVPVGGFANLVPYINTGILILLLLITIF